MSDDWCLPDYTPTPPARRRPAATVWTATINDRPFTAQLRDQGEEFGFDALILRNGDLHFSRRFARRNPASPGWKGSARPVADEFDQPGRLGRIATACTGSLAASAIVQNGRRWQGRRTPLTLRMRMVVKSTRSTAWATAAEARR